MLDDYQDLIDELLHTPSTFRDLLAQGASADVVALVVMLSDRDDAVLARLNRMTREEEPHLRTLPPASPAPTTKSAAEALADFDTARGELVSKLMNLTLKDWGRTAFTEAGSVSLAEEVESHVEFDESTVAQVEAALA